MISSNRANDAGAGFYVENSTPLIVNTLISGNHANFGAGVTLTQGSHARLVNVTIAGNRSSDAGGAIRISSSNLYFVNSIAYGNSNGISNNGGNLFQSYSMVQGINNTNQGNLNGNTVTVPFVTDISYNLAPTVDGDFRIGGATAAINAGSNDLIPGVTMDLAGLPRIDGASVEMGAYEISCIASKVLYVDSSVAVSGNGLSWAQAFKTLKEATFMAEVCPNVDSILVAKGTYYPTGARTETNRDASFVISRGLSLIGGYPSGGGQPNAGVNTTILSGDINVPNDNTDNSYHVLVLAGIPVGQTAYVDGFKIIWGNASGSNDFPYNSQFLNRNQGGGIVTKR